MSERSIPLARLSTFVALIVVSPIAAGAAEAVAPEPSGSDVVLLVAYIFLALLVSFMCSVAEAVLLSITPSFIGGLERTDPKRAALVRKLKGENIDRSLAAILTLNTIAHTVGAIGAGAKATVVFGSAWFGVFSAVMTLLILFLSEIVPKTLGAVYWRSLTGVTAVYVNVLVKSLYPLILVSEKLTKLIAGGKTVHTFSRDEFVAMARIGQESGQLDDRESRIIRNLFRLSSLSAQDIMTPRTVVVALQQDMTISDALQVRADTSFSRLPIYATTLDTVSGFVLREDLLIAQTQGTGNRAVAELRRDILTVAGPTPLTTVLERLLARRHHIAIVIGEYGETKGVVTLEDVVETLLGIEIVDEGDRVEDLQAVARQLWRKRAQVAGLEIEGADPKPSDEASTQ